MTEQVKRRKNKKPMREQQIRMLTGIVIRMLRETKGLTQEDVAKRAEMERTSITNIENGTQGTPLHILFALSKALGMKASRIVNQIESLSGDLPQ